MPYYSPPKERPRQAKRFLTAREVEDMAAAGTLEIVHVSDLVITDAARETAHDLGVRIIQPSQQQPPQKQAASPAAPPPRTAAPEGAGIAMPQPGFIGGSPLVATAPAARQADPLVKALVQAVRANPGLAGPARKG